jgi:hypothetical protein
MILLFRVSVEQEDDDDANGTDEDSSKHASSLAGTSSFVCLLV